MIKAALSTIYTSKKFAFALKWQIFFLSHKIANFLLMHPNTLLQEIVFLRIFF